MLTFFIFRRRYLFQWKTTTICSVKRVLCIAWGYLISCVYNLLLFEKVVKGKITDHVLNITLYTGKLLRNDGSYRSKLEALKLMNRALHIRTTKHGAHHTLTNCVRKSVKYLRKETERGYYHMSQKKLQSDFPHK